MKVLLVGNYETDGQESMLRFGRALETGLSSLGCDVRLVRPASRVGRLKRAGTGLGKWLGYVDKFILFPAALRRQAKAVDVVHICDHSNAMYVPNAMGKPTLVTCNDMLAIRSAHGEFRENQTGPTGRVLQGWILRNLGRATRLTCISEATRKDVIRLTGRAAEEVSVTYMGLNYPYAPVPEVLKISDARRRGEPVESAAFAQFGLPVRPYILHVGGTQWYKNRAGVVAMYEALKRRLAERTPSLVIVGRPGAPRRSDVEQRSGVENAQLAALYSGAELMLFPSLEEGFGWPIIEAQACGCPVLTTNRAPMTEVGGAAVDYLDDPRDAEDGAKRIAELLSQAPDRRAELVTQGFANAARFRTDRMLHEYAAIYTELAGQ